MPDSLDATLREVLDTLDREGVPYLLMGGLAVRIWGLTRPTYDVDITVQCPRESFPTILSAFEKSGFTVPESHLRGHIDTLAGMDKVKFSRYLDGRPWDIDLFRVTTPYQEAAFARRRRMSLAGRETWIISPEDLILHKLVATRKRDHVDVDDILLVSGTLDVDYLRKWAKILNVDAALEGHLRESGHS